MISISRILVLLSSVFVVGSVLFGSGHYLFPDSWLAETLGHFKFQYAISLLMSILLLSLCRYYKVAIGVLLATLPILIAVIPYYIPYGLFHSQPADKLLSMVSFNVFVENKNLQRFKRYLSDKKPDIICLTEVNPDFIQVLNPVLKYYPYKIEKYDGTPFAVALFSKFPVKSQLVTETMPVIAANLSVQNHPITILTFHPNPPSNLEAKLFRDRQFGVILQSFSLRSASLIITGDLNTTQWVKPFQDFANAMDVVDTQMGFGVQPTWPAHSIWFRIPIDHVLVSKNFVVLKREVGPDVGSDHLPVYVELGLKKSETKQ